MCFGVWCMFIYLLIPPSLFIARVSTSHPSTYLLCISGEVPWIYDMIKAHEPTAQASGARILHCCGFDSEPSDLGAHFMYNELKKRGLTPKSIRMVVGPSQGGVRSVSTSVCPFACIA